MVSFLNKIKFLANFKGVNPIIYAYSFSVLDFNKTQQEFNLKMSILIIDNKITFAIYTHLDKINFTKVI